MLRTELVDLMTAHRSFDLLYFVEDPSLVVGGGIVANGHPDVLLFKSVDDLDLVEEDEDSAAGSALSMSQLIQGYW